MFTTFRILAALLMLAGIYWVARRGALAPFVPWKPSPRPPQPASDAAGVPASVPVPVPPSAAAPPVPTVGTAAQGFAVPHPTSLLGRIANNDPDAIRLGISDPAEFTSRIAANYAARMLNDDPATAKAFYLTLTAGALAKVRAAFLDPAGLYASDQAGYDANRPAQQPMYEAAWAALGL